MEHTTVCVPNFNQNMSWLSQVTYQAKFLRCTSVRYDCSNQITITITKLVALNMLDTNTVH